MPKFELTQHDLNQLSRATIQKGSKSFSLASLFFGNELKNSVYALYVWCRHCDDTIDNAHSPLDSQRLFEELKYKTQLALNHTPTSEPVFQLLAQLTTRHKIPSIYFYDLLDGMRSDSQFSEVKSEKDLELYCYRVAGAVGLIMCHIMGISSASALAHACHMGMAMQMTNIARDIGEDLQLDRVYLPSEWIQNAGWTDWSIDKKSELVQREAITLKVVSRLLSRAKELYESGDKGLVYLPLRAQLAVACARAIYSEIGNQMLYMYPRSLHRRTVVPMSRKFVLIIKTSIQVLFKNILRKKFQPVEIEQLWRPQ